MPSDVPAKRPNGRDDVIERERFGYFHCRVWLIREELQQALESPELVLELWETGLQPIIPGVQSVAEWVTDDLKDRGVQFFYDLFGITDAAARNWQGYFEGEIHAHLSGAPGEEEWDQDIKATAIPLLEEVPDRYIRERSGNGEQSEDGSDWMSERTIERLQKFTELLESGAPVPVTVVRVEQTPDGPLHTFEKTTLDKLRDEERPE